MFYISSINIDRTSSAEGVESSQDDDCLVALVFIGGVGHPEVVVLHRVPCVEKLLAKRGDTLWLCQCQLRISTSHSHKKECHYSILFFFDERLSSNGALGSVLSPLFPESLRWTSKIVFSLLVASLAHCHQIYLKPIIKWPLIISIIEYKCFKKCHWGLKPLVIQTGDISLRRFPEFWKTEKMNTLPHLIFFLDWSAQVTTAHPPRFTFLFENCALFICFD